MHNSSDIWLLLPQWASVSLWVTRLKLEKYKCLYSFVWYCEFCGMLKFKEFWCGTFRDRDKWQLRTEVIWVVDESFLHLRPSWPYIPLAPEILLIVILPIGVEGERAQNVPSTKPEFWTLDFESWGVFSFVCLFVFVFVFVVVFRGGRRR